MSIKTLHLVLTVNRPPPAETWVAEMTSAQWREGLPLKIVNVAAYLLFLGSSIYAAVFPLAMYGNIKQTYFTPAIWAFFAWPIIHFLLLGTTIYQFTSADAKAIVVDGISWGFPLLTTSYAIFVVVWAHHEHALAFVFALFLCYISCNIDLTLKKQHLPKSMGDELFVHLPFSMWYAWTAVMVFLTAFEAFGVDAGKDPDGIWTGPLVFLVFCILECCAAAWAFSPIIADRPAAFVISWTLWAIYDRQRSSPFIHGSAIAFSILSLLWVFIAMDGFYRKCTGGRTVLTDEERRPLLGN